MLVSSKLIREPTVWYSISKNSHNRRRAATFLRLFPPEISKSGRLKGWVVGLVGLVGLCFFVPCCLACLLFFMFFVLLLVLILKSQ